MLKQMKKQAKKQKKKRKAWEGKLAVRWAWEGISRTSLVVNMFSFKELPEDEQAGV